MNCPYCDSEKVKKNGRSSDSDKQRYFCNNCRKSFIETDGRLKRSVMERVLVLLLYVHNNSLRSIQSTIEIIT